MDKSLSDSRRSSHHLFLDLLLHFYFPLTHLHTHSHILSLALTPSLTSFLFFIPFRKSFLWIHILCLSFTLFNFIPFSLLFLFFSFPLQCQCLQQTGPSCDNNLTLFAPNLCGSHWIIAICGLPMLNWQPTIVDFH